MIFHLIISSFLRKLPTAAAEKLPAKVSGTLPHTQRKKEKEYEVQ